MTSTELGLDEAARRAMGERALEMVLAHFARVEREPVVRATDAAALHARASQPLPVDGASPEDVLREVEDWVLPHGRNNAHPRMFGYVSSPGTFVGAVADLLASATNQNVTSWRSAPAATEMERQVVAWIAQMVGMPASSGGLLVSGGSMANLAALSAALRAKAGVDVNRHGVRALRRDVVVYASEMTHMSIPKAAEMLGLGSACVRLVPVRDDFILDSRALEAAMREDAEAGRQPLMVVANAGDVNTGAVDDFDSLAAACARHDAWLHADAAYGGFAALAPEGKRLLEGLARADSVALDPHKWLYAPLDVACVLVRDPRHLHAAFSHGADYIEVLEGEDRAAFAWWDYGPELSRRFRALKVWMQLKTYGTRALGDAIGENIRVARHLARLVDEADDFERLAPAPLSIVCFRHVPDALRGDDAALDAHNRALVARVQRSGDAYISNAVLRGRFALRACIVNHRTREADAAALLDVIRREARAAA